MVFFMLHPRRSVDRFRERHPLRLALRQGLPPLHGQRIDFSSARRGFVPMAFKKALFFETVQGGIDRAFGQVKVTATPLSQGFDHGIPV